MSLFLLILFSFSSTSHAGVKVAFLQRYDYQGKIIQLEPYGRFMHVAVSFHGQWLHAHPVRGVELTTDLSDIGEIQEVLVNPDIPDISEAAVKAILGTPYDSQFEWSNQTKTYCSKLVGQLFGILPLPAYFGASIWKTWQLVKPGLGLSPDDLYKILKSRGYKTEMAHDCKSIFSSLQRTPI